MNARVFLLLLVTGLFMVAWNGDQAAKHQFLAQRAQQQAILAASSSVIDGNVAAQRESAATAQHTSHVMATLGDEADHFRPNGMTDGRYRAVSESGATLELTVDSHAVVADREFYIADSPGGIRWYFVRIE